MKNDYYPFGMTVPNRNYQSPEYRYGFQGQEKDDEVKGNGNSINYKFRMHDPRVGKFFAVDPLAAKYPYYSQYAFSGNRVIDMIELEGLEPKETPDKEGQEGSGTDRRHPTKRSLDNGGVVEKWITHMGVDGESPKWVKVDHYQKKVNLLIDKTIKGSDLDPDYASNRLFENDAIKEQWEIGFSKAKEDREVYRHFQKTGAIYTDDLSSPFFIQEFFQKLLQS